MFEKLGLKEHLETSFESSKRVRFTTVILVVVTVLIFAGLLNSLHNHSWIMGRKKYNEEYIKKLDAELDKPETETSFQAVKPAESGFLNKFREKFQKKNDIFSVNPPSCGNEACFELEQTDKIKCLKCSKEYRVGLLNEIKKSLVDNIYLIKVPFFGVLFDINDLGLIGGLSLLIVLLMLRLSLRNYIVCLRMIIKICVSKGNLTQIEKERFYEIIASHQLFVFPKLHDDNQEKHIGEIRKSWDNSWLKKIYRLFFGIILILVAGIFWFGRFLIHRIILYPSKNNHEATSKFKKTYYKFISPRAPAKGYYASPQPSLKSVPLVISFIPALVYLCVVVNDYRSLNVGTIIDYERAVWGFFLSLFFLINIFAMGCWCISKWLEVNKIWKIFYNRVYFSHKVAVAEKIIEVAQNKINIIGEPPK